MTVLFTKENAGEMARRAAHAREAKRALERARLAMLPADASDDARHNRVLLQIQRVDDMLMKCNRDEFPSLTAAKERLWNLIFPKAGVMRPRGSKQPRSSPAEPL